MTTPGKPVFGAGILRYPALQSPNFVTGSTGWTIKQDGSAEFNNVTIRNGQIISGTSLFYSTTTPQLGKLNASISGSSGTDSAGNDYLAGVFSYRVSPGNTHSTLAWGLDPVSNAFSFYTWNGSAWVAQGQILTTGASLQGLRLSSTIPVVFDNGVSVSAGGLAVTGGTSTDTLTASGKVTATGGTAANPTLITTDVWNSLGALAAGSGYTVNNGRFQLTNDGRVEVDINLVAGMATVAGNYAFANALPVGQRPPFQCSYPIGFNGTTAAGVNTATLRVSTAGAVTLQLPALPNTTVVSATQRIPTN